MADSNSMTVKPLGDMTKEELQKVCENIKVKFDEKDTNKMLEDRITDSGKYLSKKENAGGGVKVNDKGEKVHKTLGKYIKVKVHPTAQHNKRTSIFASIGLYTVEFQPNETIALPEKVIEFLKGLGETEHYFDANAMSENGNKGVHKSRQIAKYIVEKE